jgi:hypothetical protein
VIMLRTVHFRHQKQGGRRKKNVMIPRS